MADLPNNSFVKVNDIETAQGAPVSEALAQKYGANENTNNNEILLNDADISTNATDIATNAAAIAAILQPEVFDVSFNPSNTFGTLFTFAANPTIVIVRPDAVTDLESLPVGLLTQTNTVVRVQFTTLTLEYRLTNALLEVREAGGSIGSLNFSGAGWH